MRLVFNLAVVGVAALGGYAAPSVGGQTAFHPALKQHPIAEGSVHGPPLPITVDVVPKTASTTLGRDHLEMSINVQHRFKGKPVTLALHEDVVDDLGATVVAGRTSPSIRLAADVAVASFPTSLDTPLKDGFYVARYTVAAIGEGVENVMGVSYYFVASSGSLTPLEYSEWFSNSRASIGIKTGG